MSIDLVQIKCLPLSYNFSFLRNYSGFQASQFLSRKFLREKFKLTGIFSLAAGDASLIDAKRASFQFPKLLKQKNLLFLFPETLSLRLHVFTNLIDREALFVSLHRCQNMCQKTTLIKVCRRCLLNLQWKFTKHNSTELVFLRVNF